MNAKSSPPAAPDCSTCDTRIQSVFSDIEAPGLNVLSNTKSCRQYDKGEMIFFADDRPAGLYCIHRGTIKVYKAGSDGKEQIIRLVGPGDVLGYRSLIAGTPYASYAMPIEDAQICFIPRSEFMEMLSSNAPFSLRMMSLLSSELRIAEEKMVELARKPVRERLAETLILLERKYGLEDDHKTMSIKLTREEIANIVGTATESVIRLLSDFKREGLIDLPGRKIQICNRRALLDAANVHD